MYILFFIILLVIAGTIRYGAAELSSYITQILLRPEKEEPVVDRVYGWGVFFAGLVLLVAGYVFLEQQDPLYFTQDDALVTELPGLIYCCRTVFDGMLPEYNPFCLLGSPGWSSGGGGTYPPLYLAYLISLLMFQTEFFTLEVLAFMHMVAGYITMYILLRRMGISPYLSLLASLSFEFSGALLITGRCWHAFHALSFYLPVIFLGIHQLAYRDFNWRWIVGEGVMIGLLYHAGFPQAWFITMMLAGGAFVWLIMQNVLSWRKSLSAIPMLFIGASLIYPLYVEQSHLTQDHEMKSGYGFGISHQVMGIFFPYPLFESYNPNYWGSSYCNYGGHFAFFGAVLPFAGLIGFFLAFTTFSNENKNRSQIWGKYVWGLLAVLTFLFSLGDEGLLWHLVRMLPAGLNNHPFRSFIMFAFFACITGAIFFEDILTKWKISKLGGMFVCVIGLILVSYHLFHVRSAFYNYAFRSYPSFPDEFLEGIKNDPTGQHRIINYSQERSFDTKYAYSLPHSLPVLYEIPAFHGYDPLTENKKPFRKILSLLKEKPLETLEETGVRWAFVHERGLLIQVNIGVIREQFRKKTMKAVPEGLSEMAIITMLLSDMFPIEAAPSKYISSLNKITETIEKKQEKYELLVLPDTDKSVNVMDLHNAKPLAYFENGEKITPVVIKYQGDGLLVDISESIQNSLSKTGSDKLVLNFLYYPRHRLYLDGKPVEIESDDWGRITTEIPVGVKRVQLRYEPEWFSSFTKAGVILLIGLASMLVILNTFRDNMPVEEKKVPAPLEHL